VRDLLRIAGASFDSTDFTNGKELNPDLANRLAGEASKTAEHFCNICIRALDYCPPVDIRFGDFLRAMITADYDLVSDDPHNYRDALIDAFRFRGIRPEGVISYAEESLRWCPPEDLNGQRLVCKGLEFDLFKDLKREQKAANARILQAFAKAHASELGLDPDAKTFPIAVHSFHPIHRVRPDGRVKMEAVSEITQQKTVPVDPANPSAGEMTFYGGVTLIIDLSPEKEGEVRYAIRKSLDGRSNADERLAVQRNFRVTSADRFSLNVYGDDVGMNLPVGKGKSGLSFRMVHKGY
jgi:hypothetical protein